jgi:hypothetical protein
VLRQRVEHGRLVQGVVSEPGAVEQRGIEEPVAQVGAVISLRGNQEASKEGKRVKWGTRAKREEVVCLWWASGARARVGHRHSRHEIEMRGWCCGSAPKKGR